MKKCRDLLLILGLIIVLLLQTTLAVAAKATSAPAETLPLTGDNTPFSLIIGAMVIAALVIVSVLISTRKK